MERALITRPPAWYQCAALSFRRIIIWGAFMSDVWEFREQVPHDGQRWGKWRFDEKARWLEYDDDEASLCIDLTAIDGSARMLDWSLPVERPRLVHP